MPCPRCGAEITGTQCKFCGAASGSPGGAASPQMGQPTAADPEWQAAMRQPTANDPSWQSAMGQPGGNYGAPAGAPMAAAPATGMAKKGCCGCLSVMVVAIATAGIAAALLAFAA